MALLACGSCAAVPWGACGVFLLSGAAGWRVWCWPGCFRYRPGCGVAGDDRGLAGRDHLCRPPARAAGGAAVAHDGDRQGGRGDGVVPVPQGNRVGGPEVGAGLLASGAGQAAEGIDAPAGEIARARMSASPSAAGSAWCPIQEPISHHATGRRSWSPIVARSGLGSRRVALSARCGGVGGGVISGVSARALTSGAGLGDCGGPAGRRRGGGLRPGAAIIGRFGEAVVGRSGGVVVPQFGEPVVGPEPLERALASSCRFLSFMRRSPVQLEAGRRIAAVTAR